MSFERRVDLGLAVIWMAIALAAIALGWHTGLGMGLVVFSTFAAGERWQSFWTRDLPR